MAFRGPKVWLWRWRRNPLRRPADKVEAWVVLASWTVGVLAGLLVGLTTARTVEHSLDRERAEWRPAAARLTGAAPGRADDRPEDAGEQVWAEVAWTAPDGTRRTGEVRVDPGTRAGTQVTVWTDDRGRLVGRPVDAAQARLQSTLAGILGGLSAAAVPLVAGRAVRRRLEERRLDLWDLHWARFDPLWRGRTG